MKNSVCSNCSEYEKRIEELSRRLKIQDAQLQDLLLLKATLGLILDLYYPLTEAQRP